MLHVHDYNPAIGGSASRRSRPCWESAYTVGYERSSRSVDDGPVEPSTLRVTHVYRRENGEWKIVHRHGDVLPIDQSPPMAERTT